MSEKRLSDDADANSGSKKSRPSSSIIGISRSISACQRCRTKKIRCDQNFPKCSKCAKAKVDCIGLDPATGREIPRSYVIHLEDKIAELEGLLRQNGILSPTKMSSGTISIASIIEPSDQPPSSAITSSSANTPNSVATITARTGGSPLASTPLIKTESEQQQQQQQPKEPLSPSYDETNMHYLMEGVSGGTMRSGSKAPPGYLDKNSDGISFAKLMFTAVKVNQKLSRRSSTPFQSLNQGAQQSQTSAPQVKSKTPTPLANPNSNTNSVSSTGAPTTNASNAEANSSQAAPVIDPSVYLKHEVLPAILPPKATAQEFIKIFFAQSNSQLPVLHREEFIRDCFVPVYGALDEGISLASNYTAINRSVIDKGDPDLGGDGKDGWFYHYKNEFTKYIKSHPNEKVDPIKISQSIVPPAKYHKALYFLNIVFAISSSVHHLQYPATISDSFKIAAVKYIEPVYSSQDQLESLQGILLLALYSIMRPAVPGVWYVLGSALRVVVDLGLHNESAQSNRSFDSFTKDKRRRLFWCTYSLDRQICFYLGRPVGIPEECISVPFPSELDDALIIPNDESNNDYSNNNSGMSTYKVISLSFFRIRQIQSEVQRILYYEKSELPRKYSSLEQWQQDVSERLTNWKNQAPKTKRKMNCDFNLEFFNLNYYHTIIMLHGINPRKFSLSVTDFYRVSEAAKELISCYHQLCYSKSINYTWAAVHNLFMAGSSYLYTIHNSPQVRERNSFFEVKKVTQECITVLNSLIDRCDAASNCKDIFEVLTAAIVKIRYNEVVQGVSGGANSTSASNGDNTIPTTQQIARSSPAGHVNSNLQQLVHNLNGDEQKENNNQQLQPQYSHQSSNQNSPIKVKVEVESPNVGGQTKFHLNPFQSTPPDLRSYPQQLKEMQQSLDSNSYTNFTNSYASNNPNAPNNTNSSYSNQIPTNDLHLGSPQTFEWITDKNAQDLLGKQQQVHYDLDIFFDELENLSSEASFENPRSPRDILTDSTDHDNIAALSNSNDIYSSSNLSSTPYSNESISTGEKSRQPSSSASGGAPGPTSGMGQRIASGNVSSGSPEQRGTPTREAKRVYELIHQMPTESIWDQFFTTSGSSVFNNNGGFQ